MTRNVKGIKSVVTHSGKDGSQRADCQDEQQDFSHCKCDVVCNQPAPQHVSTQKNIERKIQHREQSTSQQLHKENDTVQNNITVGWPVLQATVI